MKIGKRLLSLLLCFVMLVGLLPTTAFAANEYVDFLTTDLNVEFAETGESGFMRVNLFGNGKAMKLPLVYRTDNLNLKFAGWYTEKEGGVEVDESTVFDGYTILYDRWEESNIEQSKKISEINIPIANPVNGQTALQWYNASSLNISVDGVEDLSSYAFYHGLNASGAQLTDAEVIDTDEDYSAVTVLRLENGYYFDDDITLIAANGVRAGTVYQGNGGISSNYWNSEARQILVTINFPAGANTNGFTTEPVGGTVNAGQPFNFTWAVSGDPTEAELQMKNGNVWAKADELTVNNPSGTIAAQTGTKTYRILVTYGNSGSIYCNEFTVTWLADVVNSFSMSPASGTVKNGTDYDFTWACVRTPATATIERKTGTDWTSPEDLGTATSRTITYKETYANSPQTFRIKATMATGDPFYSNEFTVTYKATPLFTVQPADGKVAINATYTVNYAFDKGDAQNDGDKVLQKYNGNDWDNISTSEVYFTQAVVPAQDAETTGTYRIGIQEDGNWTYSESFTVQWVDDYTFEMDKDSLAWGSIAKTDGYNEYAKMIKIMHTGTKTGTLKYDTPTNFYVQYWHGANYDTLTFTPKTDITAGTHNESVHVWATSDGSDELEKKTVNLSITVVDETPTYTISFAPGEGTGSMASVPNTTGTYELPDCTFTAPANKEFKAWQVNGGEEKNPGESIPVTGNTVLTAVWKDIPVVSGFTVSFAPGEGTGTMADVNNVSGDYILPDCDFTAPSGMKFKNWLVGGVARAAGATVQITANTTVTAQWETVETWTVFVSSGNVCGMGSYNTTQYVEQGQAMTDIIITANDGYYFPTSLNVPEQNGVTVTRIDYTQVKISGTPTSNVDLSFGPSTKSKEDQPTNLSFEATGADTGNLCNLETGVTYSVTGAATAEFTATGSTYGLTNVTEGTLNVVKKASNPNTKLDSDAYAYTVGKKNSVPNLYSTNCSDSNNNNGQIWNVSAEMEYQKEGDNNWTTGTDANVTGLTPGTYYVRYKASSINLAGNAQTINIAAYNVPTLTGTVEITGDAKFGEQLTADVSGITNNTGTLSYQWKRNETNISGANSATYTLVEADIGYAIKVVVTSSVESGSITSDTTAPVEKADGPVAPTGLAGVSPTTNGGSDGKITGTADTMEYSTDSSFTNPTGTVCPDTETTGLTAGTYYVRVKETATHKAGANATVTVPAYVAANTYTVTVTNGTATPTGPYAAGANVTITADSPPQGKVFDKWEVTGATVANVNSATTSFTMPANAVTATATYKDIPQQPTTYTVTVTNGTATPTGPNAAGTNVTITAGNPPQGKVFDKWEVTGATVANVNSATTSFTMPANAVTATATYKDAPQQSTTTLTDIVITTPPTKTTYTAGESFDPAGMVVTGYYSDQSSRPLNSNEYTYAPAGALTANDTKITVTYDDAGTIKTAEQAITVSPAQQPTTYTVSFAANGGSGTMADVNNVSGEYTLPANGFTAPLGKWFKCWSVGGVEKAVGDKITVAANTTVTAVWAGNTYNPRPNYPIYINPTPGSSSTGQIIAAKTFDGGIGLSVAVTILSAAGGAWLAKKKED